MLEEFKNLVWQIQLALIVFCCVLLVLVSVNPAAGAAMINFSMACWALYYKAKTNTPNKD